MRVRPNDIDISGGLVGSRLGKSELETIARNIIVLSRENDNKWLSFTFEKYESLCNRKVTASERWVLDDFVTDGLLECNNGVYSVLDTFVGMLAEFID